MPFSAFVVALFAEMYGFPLTIYVLSGWLQTAFPGIDWWSDDGGHLLEMMFGWRASPHFGPFHTASFVLIGGGYGTRIALDPMPIEGVVTFGVFVTLSGTDRYTIDLVVGNTSPNEVSRSCRRRVDGLLPAETCVFQRPAKARGGLESRVRLLRPVEVLTW